MRLSGKLDNSSYENAKDELTKYLKNSDLALVFYLMYIGRYFLSLISGKLEFMGLISNVIGLISIILLFVFIVKSMINYYRFRKHLNKKEDYILYIILFLAIPVYFIVYLYTKKKLTEELNSI